MQQQQQQQHQKKKQQQKQQKQNQCWPHDEQNEKNLASACCPTRARDACKLAPSRPPSARDSELKQKRVRKKKKKNTKTKKKQKKIKTSLCAIPRHKLFGHKLLAFLPHPENSHVKVGGARFIVPNTTRPTTQHQDKREEEGPTLSEKNQ